MREENQSYRVKSVYSIETTVGIGIQAALWFYMAQTQQKALVMNDSLEGVFAYRITVIIGLLMTAVVLFTVWKMRRPDYALALNENKIKLRKRELTGDQIKRIYVSREENPLIGIKPRGSLFVPNDYSFKFQEASASKLQELLSWAEDNGVPVVKKKGVSWL